MPKLLKVLCKKSRFLSLSPNLSNNDALVFPTSQKLAPLGRLPTHLWHIMQIIVNSSKGTNACFSSCHSQHTQQETKNRLIQKLHFRRTVQPLKTFGHTWQIFGCMCNQNSSTQEPWLSTAVSTVCVERRLLLPSALITIKLPHLKFPLSSSCHPRLVKNIVWNPSTWQVY